ncbi:MAG: DUF3368 domain-containing protein [Bacteroidetes bacterium]|nr:DUF3368 domain-containing protein [Bacteroidota bacterium]
MLKVVSNTTPLLTLLKISKLNLLKEIYGEIIIPDAVYEEIEHGKNMKYYTDLKKLDWIKISSVKNKNDSRYFIDLDKGEAEVIILAEENNADIVIIDERIGREYANYYKLKVTGTIGILLKAKQKGLIKELRPLLAEMKEKGVWVSDNLIKTILEIVKEA